MIDFNLLTSLIAVPLLVLVLRGLWPFWRGGFREDMRLFSLGLGWIIGTLALRTIYWGVAYGILGGTNAWAAWSDMVGGANIVNGVFHVGFTIGAWAILMAFREMIPEEERANWSPLRAPFYPRGLQWPQLRRFFCRRH